MPAMAAELGPFALPACDWEPIDLQEAKDAVGRRQCITVCVLSEWGAGEMAKVEGKAKLLPLMMGTALTLTECKGDWWRGFCSQSPENVGWCPQNKFATWEVCKPFHVERENETKLHSNSQFLSLDLGDSVVLSAIWDDGPWKGWGRGQKRGARMMDGLVRLDHATPKVIARLSVNQKSF